MPTMSLSLLRPLFIAFALVLTYLAIASTVSAQTNDACNPITITQGQTLAVTATVTGEGRNQTDSIYVDWGGDGEGEFYQYTTSYWKYSQPGTYQIMFEGGMDFEPGFSYVNLTTSLSAPGVYEAAEASDSDREQSWLGGANHVYIYCTVTVNPAASPDLTGLGTSVSGSVVAGQTTSFSAQARNIGSAAAGTFSSYFMISNGANAWTGPVSSLGAGGSAWVGSSYSFGSPGTYSVQLCVDGYGQVAESNEGNNCGPATTFTVYAPPTATLTLSPSSVAYGGSSTVSWSSANASSCTGTNFSTGGATSGSVSVSATNSTTYRVDCSGPGGSAWDAKTLTVGAQPFPDLTAATGPAVSGAVGTPLTLTSDISNIGNATAPAFYNVLRVCDAGCTSYDQNANAQTAALASGAGRTASFSHTISAPAGQYYYMICADVPYYQVTESNEDNNCTGWQNITLANAPAADLTAGTTVVTGTRQVGTSLNFSAPASNTGNATSGSFPILFQVSNGALVNSGYLSGLVPGGSAWGGANYTFSSPGTYQVRACANYNTAWTAIVTESNYGNNCQDPWTTVVIDPVPATPPTCSITSSPSTVTTGQSSTITWTSSNASSCTGSNFSTGGAANGSVSVTPSSSTQYGVTCTGAGGSCTTSPNATVNVNAPTACSAAAVADIKVNGSDEPIRVAVDSSVAVTWNAGGVLNGSCTISGPGVSQTANMSAAPACTIPAGSANPTVSTQSVYTITCGSVSDSVIVNVTPKVKEF